MPGSTWLSARPPAVTSAASYPSVPSTGTRSPFKASTSACRVGLLSSVTGAPSSSPACRSAAATSRRGRPQPRFLRARAAVTVPRLRRRVDQEPSQLLAVDRRQQVDHEGEGILRTAAGDELREIHRRGARDPSVGEHERTVAASENAVRSVHEPDRRVLERDPGEIARPPRRAREGDERGDGVHQREIERGQPLVAVTSRSRARVALAPRRQEERGAGQGLAAGEPDRPSHEFRLHGDDVCFPAEAHPAREGPALQRVAHVPGTTARREDLLERGLDGRHPQRVGSARARRSAARRAGPATGTAALRRRTGARLPPDPATLSGCTACHRSRGPWSRFGASSRGGARGGPPRPRAPPPRDPPRRRRPRSGPPSSRRSSRAIVSERLPGDHLVLSGRAGTRGGVVARLGGSGIVSAPIPSDVPHRKGTLIARELLTPTLGIFRFELEGGVPPFLAGQYLTLGLEVEGEIVWRPYSVASPPEETRFVEFLVRWAVHPVAGRFTTRPGAARGGRRLLLEGAQGALHRARGASGRASGPPASAPGRRRDRRRALRELRESPAGEPRRAGGRALAGGELRGRARVSQRVRGSRGGGTPHVRPHDQPPPGGSQRRLAGRDRQGGAVAGDGGRRRALSARARAGRTARSGGDLRARLRSRAHGRERARAARPPRLP